MVSPEQKLVSAQVSVNRCVWAMNKMRNDGNFETSDGRRATEYIVDEAEKAMQDLAKAREGYSKQKDLFL